MNRRGHVNTWISLALGVLLVALIFTVTGLQHFIFHPQAASAYDLPSDISPPPKQPARPEPRWYSFADITVQQSNTWTFNTAQADGWSYSDRELIDQIVSEQEPGTKFTLYHLKDSHYLAWSFAGRSQKTNVRAFLYGVHYVFPDGSERDEFRLHGSLPISTWQTKGPRSYVEEATNEELNL